MATEAKASFPFENIKNYYFFIAGICVGGIHVWTERDNSNCGFQRFEVVNQIET